MGNDRIAAPEAVAARLQAELDAKMWTCPNCAFTCAAIHVTAGSPTPCAACEVVSLNEANAALTAELASTQRAMAEDRHEATLSLEAATAELAKMSRKLEEAGRVVAKLTTDLEHATSADGDHLSIASRRMVDTVMGDREALRDRWRTMRNALHSLPSLVLAVIAAKCRETAIPCFCGCHRTDIDTVSKGKT